MRSPQIRLEPPLKRTREMQLDQHYYKTGYASYRIEKVFETASPIVRVLIKTRLYKGDWRKDEYEFVFSTTGDTVPKIKGSHIVVPEYGEFSLHRSIALIVGWTKEGETFALQYKENYPDKAAISTVQVDAAKADPLEFRFTINKY